MTERIENGYLVVELVPDIIEAHAGIREGDPVIAGTRISVEIAAITYTEKSWASWRGALAEEQAKIAFAFEAGRNYQKNRKLRKRIEQSNIDGGERYVARLNAEEFKKQRTLGYNF